MQITYEKAKPDKMLWNAAVTMWSGLSRQLKSYPNAVSPMISNVCYSEYIPTSFLYISSWWHKCNAIKYAFYTVIPRKLNSPRITWNKVVNKGTARITRTTDQSASVTFMQTSNQRSYIFRSSLIFVSICVFVHLLSAASLVFIFRCLSAHLCVK